MWDIMFNKVGKEVMLEVARLDLKMVEIVPLLIGEASVDEEIYRLHPCDCVHFVILLGGRDWILVDDLEVKRVNYYDLLTWRIVDDNSFKISGLS
ncbi:hypothetical protein L195_g042555 [Trifolium pratense]|uniref:Uncharacterized protein n=1 Tax=Trifolium pratense TaxID=57577 RepID=A0A2K3M6Q9_TRIPR|nr:hypothetical protein L195_g042555 [Trifolium pratense]